MLKLLTPDFRNLPKQYVALAFSLDPGKSKDSNIWLAVDGRIGDTADEAHALALKEYEMVAQSNTLLGIHTFPLPSNILQELRHIDLNEARIALLEKEIADVRAQAQHKLETLGHQLNELRTITWDGSPNTGKGNDNLF